jgi:hypothetical protein
LNKEELKKVPEYVSDKPVRAIKIQSIVSGSSSTKAPWGGALITPANQDIESFGIGGGFMTKYRPHAGGYITFTANGEASSFITKEEFDRDYKIVK